MGGERFGVRRSRRRRGVSSVALLAMLALAGVVPASASESSGVVAWGDNVDGQLGNGTTTTEKEPVAVKVLAEATAVAGGESHSLALLKSGKVMAWGDNVDGQLGNGTTTTEKEPVEVKGLTEVVAIAAGADHSLALLKSGKVMAWGDNVDGQLGNGTTTTEKEPVEVKCLTEVVAIAAGSDHSLAVLKSGKVKAWGDNNDGQLGNGTATTEKEPVEVKGLSEATAVAGGEFHSLALLASGKVKAWGENADGQLGNGTTTTEKEPVEVKGLSEAITVAAGHSHSLAVLKSGKVKAWGDNNDGQLGNDTATTEKEPVEVKGLSEAVAVAGGEFHSLALLASGKVMAWGDNVDGQLGNGTTTTEKEPVEVTGLSRIADISAGADFSLAAYAIPPANSALPTISGEAKDERTLSASAGSWSGTPTITYGYQWESCNATGESCSNISGATGASYMVAHEEVGHTIRVKVTAKNSVGEASGSSAQTATVAASAPANTGLPVVSGEAKDERTLSASAGSWSGTPTITYAYQWESCNTAGEACSSISGATGASYTVAHEQVGHTLRVKATASNAAGESSASSAQTATVLASAPASIVLPVVSGEAKDERTLSASTGSWAGSPTITYGYQWESCNAAGEGCSSISGATGTSYTVAHEEVGHTIRITVTAKNSVGEASASSAQTATVAASAPANIVLPVVSGEARDERTLSASTGSWAGTPAITYGYQWESCDTAGEGCSSISGATEASYTVAHQEVGHTLGVKVTASNAAGESSASSAQTATVAASAPVNTALPTISGEAKQGKTLTASTGSWTGTPPLSYAFQWQSCDSLGDSCLDVSGATSATHLLGASEIGGTLRVAIRASNAAGSVQSTSEATSVVAASTCTDSWTGASEGTWQTPSNWSTGEVPGPSDVACIESGDTVRVGAGTSEVGVLKDEGALEIAGGTLETTSTVEASTVEALSLNGGALSGAGKVDVTSSFTSGGYGGELTGAGSTVIEAGATGTITSRYDLYLEERTLENDGSLVVEHESAIVGSRKAKLINRGTLTVNGELYGDEGAELQNRGTLRKTEGAWGSEVQFAIDNEGTVSTMAGVLRFVEGGGTSGVLHADVWTAEGAGTAIDFGHGTYSLGAAATLSGAVSVGGQVSVGTLSGANGQVSVVEGRLTVEGAGSTLERLVVDEFSAFVLSGELAVSKSIVLGGGGYVEGSGRLVLDSGATGVADGSSASSFSSVTLENDGAFTVEHEAKIVGKGKAKFVNNGTLTVNGGLGHESEGAELVNYGTLRKTEGEWSSEVEFAIDNEGTVSTMAGVLRFVEGGGTSGVLHADVWTAEGAGTAIDFGHGTYSLGAAATLSGAVSVGGQVSVGTLSGANGQVSVVEGRLTVEGAGSTLERLVVDEFSAFVLSGELAVSKSIVLGGGGYVEGSGRLVLDSGATGVADGSSASSFSSVTLENDGAFTVEHEAKIVGKGKAKFVNNGTLTVNGGLGHESEGAELVNYGTLRKTEGEWSSEVEFAIDNEGTVSTMAGVLRFVEGGGTSGVLHADVWTAEGAGTAIEFGYGSYDLGSSPYMSGALNVSGEAESPGKVEAGRLDGDVTVVSLSGGTLSIGGSLALEALTIRFGSLYVADEVSIDGNFAWEGGGTVSVGELVLGLTSEISTYLGSPQTLTGDVVNGPEDMVVWGDGGLVGKEVTFVNDGTFEVDASSPLEDPTSMQQGGGAMFLNEGAITSVGEVATMEWSYLNAGSLPGELGGRLCVITEPEEPPIPSRGFYAFGEAGDLVFTPEGGGLFPPDITPGPDEWRCVEG
jgi:alpha-tubulin suppressor-like RCC1 family protein